MSIERDFVNLDQKLANLQGRLTTVKSGEELATINLINTEIMKARGDLMRIQVKIEIAADG